VSPASVATDVGPEYLLNFVQPRCV
jgi:hypothetical protein